MNNKSINDIYKILLLFEDVHNDYSCVTAQDYLRYLDRLYIYWLGVGRSDIFYLIKGLKSLGTETSHQTIKSTVWHIIELIKKGEEINNGVENV